MDRSDLFLVQLFPLTIFISHLIILIRDDHAGEMLLLGCICSMFWMTKNKKDYDEIKKEELTVQRGNEDV